MLAPTKEIEKQPPHAIEAEQALLGAILIDNAICNRVSGIITPDDFYDGAHARLFDKIRSLIHEGREVTPITLMPLFRNDQTLREIGGEGYIIRLSSAVISTVSAVDHARAIAECARQRRLSEIGAALAEDASEVSALALDNLVAEAMEALVADSAPAGEEREKVCRSLSESAEHIIDRVNTAYQLGRPAETVPYPGSDTLADVIGGWRRKRLITIGARTSIGKTTFATSLLLRTAFRGEGVLIIELEMEASEIAERCLSDLTYDSEHPVAYDRIARDNVSEPDILSLLEAKQKLASLPFRIIDKAGLTIAQARALIQQEKREMAKKGQNLSVVCFDHMGLLKASERYSGNKVAETEEVSGALKQLAKDLDVAVVNVMQLNRQVEARETKAPTLADLRWSGAVEQDSDVVMLLHRPAYYIQREYCADADGEIDRAARLQSVEHLLEVNIAKNRGGACPQLKFHCDVAYSAIRDVEGRS